MANVLKGLAVRGMALASAAAIGLVMGAVPAQASGAEPVAAAACNEACLRAALDSFLAGFGARKPAEAGLAAKARYTENGIELPVGQGLWRTIDGFGAYRNAVFDAKLGQIGVFIDLTENGVHQLAGLRVKVAGGKVTEAEVLIQRKQASRFLNTEGLSLKPVWGEVLPAAKRVSRDVLAAAANAYFDALSKGSGASVPFDDAVCERYENGIQTAGTRAVPPPGGALPSSSSGFTLMRCGQQFDSGSTVYIQSVEPRRILAMDESRGLVFGIFHFQHPGDITSYRTPDGTTKPMPEAATRPFTAPAAEMFKLVDGKIVAIEALVVTVPYGSPSPWK